VTVAVALLAVMMIAYLLLRVEHLELPQLNAFCGQDVVRRPFGPAVAGLGSSSPAWAKHPISPALRPGLFSPYEND
jgi:hypothetical protein